MIYYYDLNYLKQKIKDIAMKAEFSCGYNFIVCFDGFIEFDIAINTYNPEVIRIRHPKEIRSRYENPQKYQKDHIAIIEKVHFSRVLFMQKTLKQFLEDQTP